LVRFLREVRTNNPRALHCFGSRGGWVATYERRSVDLVCVATTRHLE
jgi:hypothetical protein